MTAMELWSTILQMSCHKGHEQSAYGTMVDYVMDELFTLYAVAI